MSDETLLDRIVSDTDIKELSIGQTAQLMGLSVRQVRHYCSKNLLTPSRIDEISGYRYFNPESLSRLSLIKEMLSLGFSLQQIKSALVDSQSGINQLINEKIQAHKSEILKLSAKINQLEEYQQKIAHYGKKPLPPDGLREVKDYPVRHLLTSKMHLPFPNGLIYQKEFIRLTEKARELKCKPLSGMIALYDDPIQRERSQTITFALEIDSKPNIPDPESVAYNILKQGAYARLLFQGSYTRLYHKILPDFYHWIPDQGYRIINQAIEIYHLTRPIVELDYEFVTEIHFPVELLPAIE